MNETDRVKALDQLDALRVTLATETPEPENTPSPTPSTAVTLRGALTREPEIRYTREGIANCQLGIACTDKGSESTSYFDVVTWSDLAENCALSLCKGYTVTVTGRLVLRTWETEEEEHRSRVEVEADDVAVSLRMATADVHAVQRRS